MAVLKDHRGKKYAGYMMENMIKYLKDKQLCKKVYCEG